MWKFHRVLSSIRLSSWLLLDVVGIRAYLLWRAWFQINRSKASITIEPVKWMFWSPSAYKRSIYVKPSAGECAVALCVCKKKKKKVQASILKYLIAKKCQPSSEHLSQNHWSEVTATNTVTIKGLKYCTSYQNVTETEWANAVGKETCLIQGCQKPSCV